MDTPPDFLSVKVMALSARGYTMNDVSKDDAVMATLLTRFEKIRLPRALELKKKVDAGGTLTEHELTYLEALLLDSNKIKAMIDERPKLQNLYAKAVHLYHEITTKAVENERGSGSGS